MINLDLSLHSVLVHFTVSLLVTSAALALLGAAFRAKPWTATALTVARWNLILGTIATIFTVAAGFYEYLTVDHDSPSHAVMTTHRNLALITFALFTILAVWAWRSKDANKVAAGSFLIPLVAGAGLLTATGYLGGELVYKYGLGVQSLPAVSGEGHDHEHAPGEGHGDSASEAAVDEPEGHEHAAGEGHDDAAAAPATQAAGDHEHADSAEHSHDDAAGSAGNGTVDRADPATIADAFSAALFAGDGDAVGHLLAADVMILESGHAQTSRADYMSGHMISDMAFLPHVTSTILDRKASQSGDLAWVITHSRMVGTYKGEAIDSASREMLVMRHTGEKWEITLVHWGDK